MLSAQFTHIMVAYIFSTIAPGADLMMVIRQALLHGRRHALVTCLGIGMAVFGHITYTVLGLGLIVSRSHTAFETIKWLGIIYLVYIGIMALKEGGVDIDFAENEEKDMGGLSHAQSYLKAFLLGLTVDLLNPQAIFFFLSIFSTLVKTNTAFFIQFCYGVLMAIIVILWMALVSYVITSNNLRGRFLKLSRWINALSGLYFVGLGISLIWQNSF